MPITGLTAGVIYEIEEVNRKNTYAPMRPVKVVNDFGVASVVFAARFNEIIVEDFH